MPVLNSLQSTREYYTKLLSIKKTVRSKRATVNLDIKTTQSFIADVKEALERTDSSVGWYLGDKYTEHDLSHYQKELELLKEIYNSI